MPQSYESRGSHMDGAHDGYNSYGAAYTSYGSAYGGNGGHHHHHHHRHGHKGGSRAVTRRAAVAAGAVAGVAGVGVFASTACAANPLDMIDGVMGKARELVSTVSEMAQALKGGDFAAAAEAARTFTSQAGDLRDSMTGFLWDLAQMVPVFGGDVSAARTLVGAVCDLGSDALVPLTDALATSPISSMVSSIEGGAQIDVATLRTLIDEVLAAVPHVRSFVETLNGIGELHVEQLADAVNSVKEQIGTYYDMLDAAEKVLPRIPALLGADGSPRRYLLVAQTNCEIRSTGGFPGALILVDAADGTVAMGERLSISDLMPWVRDDPLPITDEELEIFGARVSYIPGDMGYIPHLPRAASMWAECTARSGAPVDGVITADPVLLQRLLALCGSVPMSNGSVLDGTSTARLLLRDVYMVYGDQSQLHDAYFSEAVSSASELIFSSIGSVDVGQLVGVLAEGARTRRLGMWLRDEEEEELLRSLETGITNELVQDAKKPTAGIFFANDTWGKMDWWLDAELHVGKPASNGRISMEMTLTNFMTPEEVAEAPKYVTGGNWDARELGDMLTWVYLYAPYDGTIQVTDGGMGNLSGYVPDFRTGVHMGFNVAYALLQILPGETITLRWNVTPAIVADSDAELALDITPTCQGVRVVRA